jgi:GH15 family glucan-1,4-alpha-glucosidase
MNHEPAHQIHHTNAPERHPTPIDGPTVKPSLPGRHLGNFPQALSHLALVETAARIIVAESLSDFEG